MKILVDIFRKCRALALCGMVTICEKGEHNEYGQFLKFENLTFCPLDIDAIDPKYMDVSDVRKFNAYQKLVYETLAPHLCENGRSKLAYMTRPIEY